MASSSTDLTIHVDSKGADKREKKKDSRLAKVKKDEKGGAIDEEELEELKDVFALRKPKHVMGGLKNGTPLAGQASRPDSPHPSAAGPSVPFRASCALDGEHGCWQHTAAWLSTACRGPRSCL